MLCIGNAVQEKLVEGGTILAGIFASDKTTLTRHSGAKSAYPLYMSLGNIAKAIRSQAYLRAWRLIALLPIPSKEDMANLKAIYQSASIEQDFRREILHASIRVILNEFSVYAERYEPNPNVHFADAK